jgi:thymidylate synthase
MSEGDINYDFTKLMRKNIDHLSQDKYILDTHEEF